MRSNMIRCEVERGVTGQLFKYWRGGILVLKPAGKCHSSEFGADASNPTSSL
jgi:hypothetical protein